MTSRNLALIAARTALGMTQQELAREIRKVGAVMGEPNECDARDVQRWEAGQVKRPRSYYLRAMSQITGQRPQELGFAAPAEPTEPSGMDRREVLTLAAVAAMPLAEGDEHQPVGGLQGIWRSEYQYVSSSRGGQTFTCNHYAVIVHRGERLRLRSLPKTADGQIAMELSLRDGQVVTGTWEERTDPSGYYKGAVYYGAIQMVVRPNGTRMSGSWVGFGREGEVNTGPWKLTLVTHDTGREKLAEYNCPVVAKTPDGDDAEPVT